MEITSLAARGVSPCNSLARERSPMGQEGSIVECKQDNGLLKITNVQLRIPVELGSPLSNVRRYQPGGIGKEKR